MADFARHLMRDPPHAGGLFGRPRHSSLAEDWLFAPIANPTRRGAGSFVRRSNPRTKDPV